MTKSLTHKYKFIENVIQNNRVLHKIYEKNYFDCQCGSCRIYQRQEGYRKKFYENFLETLVDENLRASNKSFTTAVWD